MKPHHRHGSLLLAIALLATAGLLGVSRWSQPATSADSGQPASPPAREEVAVFSGLAPNPGNARPADERLAAKVSLRPSAGTRTSGADQPRPGELTYRMADLPKACGTYWVADANGGFSRVAVCNPANHPGGTH